MVNLHILVLCCDLRYDAVTIEGKLDWQNELNEKNRAFFDVCDGIFLNYTWKVGGVDKEKTLPNNLKVS